ncbi:hypothetical protein IJF86_03350 [Candidatus Saccharibacteria bacterium]|nr:hypothetical protein [Candidatus Saccharibacteria bacterium]
MLKIVFGDDRATISGRVKRELGEGYEVFEGDRIELGDLQNIFFGTSIFGEKRRILIKDLWENKAVFEKLGEFVGTTHDVIVWESKLDKRTAVVKKLGQEKVEILEFKLLEPTYGKNDVFGLLDVAWRDGKKAVEMVEKIENEQDPFMLVGALTAQAVKKFEWRSGKKEKRVLSELSKLDMQMKSTQLSPWTLVKSFLLQVSSW